MAARAEHYPRSSAPWWTSGVEGPIKLVRRSDLPFGIDLDCFRRAVISYQDSKVVDDIYEGIASRRLRIDSEAGQKLLQQLMDEAGVALPGADQHPHPIGRKT